MPVVFALIKSAWICCWAKGQIWIFHHSIWRKNKMQSIDDGETKKEQFHPQTTPFNQCVQWMHRHRVLYLLIPKFIPHIIGADALIYMTTYDSIYTVIFCLFFNDLMFTLILLISSSSEEEKKKKDVEEEDRRHHHHLLLLLLLLDFCFPISFSRVWFVVVGKQLN